MVTDPRVLLTSGWLSLIPPDIARDLLERASVVEFEDGDLIYNLGDQQYDLYGVLSGVVRLSISMNEQEAKLGHLASPGFWFGEAEMMMRSPRVVEALAVGPTRLVRLPEAQIERFSAERPAEWKTVPMLVALNQYLAIGAGDDLLIRDNQKRLTAVLLRLASRRSAFQSPMPLDVIPATQAEIATSANLSLSLTVSLLSKLEKEGSIKREYGAIRIVKPKRLAESLDD